MRSNLKAVTKVTFILLLVVSVFAAGTGTKSKPILDRKDMNLTIRPGDDFFQYANGGWIERAKIPDDKTSYASFNIVREKRDKDVHELLEDVAKIKSPEKGSAAQKISDFYAAGMDIKTVEVQGITPLKEEFVRIAKISSVSDVQDIVARFHTYGMDPLFNGVVLQDFKNSNIFKFYLFQAGIGLPDRDYYTKEDKRSMEIREEYVKHLAKMFQLLGDNPDAAAANAQKVMSIETRLAKKSKTRLELRDLPALYNKMSLTQLSEIAPGVDWGKYFKNISDFDFGDVIVGMPEFFKEVSTLMKEVPVNDWKTYLRWNLINRSAPYLSSDFVNQNYHFFSEFLSGSKKIRDRWKRVVETTNNLLGELVGQLYVKKHFPPESKKRMLELVSNLRKAFEIRLKNLQWMSESTKKEALAKLKAMRVKIGYPDKWEDYSKLEIKRDSYILNVRRANQFQYYKNLSQFGKPVDPDKWEMTPQTVNAGYHPIKNDLTFPAAILQPPFFYADGDDAVNYGAIGMAIGHEATHGFDDQGRRFDKDGNMKNWWAKEDAEEFKKRSQLLVDQYNSFVAVGDLHVNGELSLGENIADFGGLTIAFAAYKMSLKGKIPAPINGFSYEQRFFLSFAKVWRGKIREKTLRRIVQEDVHPWGKFRTNGAPFNMPEFYKVFNIQAEDRLYRTEKQRPIIW